MILALALALGVLMQPWGDLNLGDRIVLMGLPTFGKTTLTEKLVARAERVLWFSSIRDFEKPGRLVLTVDELERYPEFLQDDVSRIVVRTHGRGKQLAEQWLRMWTAAEAAGADFDRTREGGRIVVTDEVGDLRPFLEQDLNESFRKGRHFGIVPIFASQLATDIPFRCRKLASKTLCLGQRHRDELRALAASYDETFAARVGAWRKYEPPIEWTAEAVVEPES